MTEQQIAETVKAALVMNRWAQEVSTETLAEHIAHRITNASKRERLTEALSMGAVLVLFDPRRGRASVPPLFRTKGVLTLRIGYNLNPPIPDLAISDDGWSGTLRFGSTVHTCVVSWEAVFALQTEGHEPIAIWRDSIPEDAYRAHTAAVKAAAEEKPKRHLALVPETPEDS